MDHKIHKDLFVCLFELFNFKNYFQINIHIYHFPTLGPKYLEHDHQNIIAQLSISISC